MRDRHIEGIIAECEDAIGFGNKEVSDWEVEFIQSVSDQFDERGSLSDRQVEILEKVHEKIT